MELKQWFLRNAKIPLLLTFLSVLGVQCLYSFFWIQTHHRKQLQQMRHLVQIGSLAITQNNRPLLEATMALGFDELSAHVMMVCHNSEPVVTYPSLRARCHESKSDFWTRHLSFSATGAEGYEFIAIVPKFGDRLPTFFLMGSSLIILLGISGLSFRIYRALQTDILKPLIDSKRSSDSPFRINELEEIRRQNQTLEELRSREAVAQAIVLQNEQVSHDIRSPLTALNVVIAEASSLPESRRILLRHAAMRIQDIANNLLRSAPGTNVEAYPSSHLVAPLVESVVSEIRLQFHSKLGVHIEADIGFESYALFSNFIPAEFKRVVSNLIGNSVQAIHEVGRVVVSVSPSDFGVQLRVSDTGKGIAPDVLPLLGRRGATFGKSGGQGLGLFHARESVESWGGKFEIESQLGEGTSVTLSLPRALAPPWFVPAICLNSRVGIVVIDDDPSIHQVWETRIGKYGRNLPIIHFSSIAKIVEWHNQSKPDPSNFLYLIDHEFANESINGIELIRNLNIASSSILVTSRHEEEQIVEACVKLGVGILPKSLAALVPIELAQEPTSIDCILVDNDPLVRTTWELSAQRNGVSLLAFPTSEILLSQLERFPVKTPIYIDSQLGNGVRGEQVAKRLYDSGFQELYLATGTPAARLDKPFWLKKVVGKTPPWNFGLKAKTN